VRLEEQYFRYSQHLKASGLDIDIMPTPITPVAFKAESLPQLQSVTAYLKDFNYAFLSRLDPDTLIYGRMPEAVGEIVVDTWVLENLIASDELTKNAMSNVTFFLDQSLYFERCNLQMTIVGICDSGEPALYLSKTDLLRICSMKPALMPLSEFQALHPGEYDSITLSNSECLINTHVMGNSYNHLVGHEYRMNMHYSWVIQAAIGSNQRAGIIVNDRVFDEYMQRLASHRFYVYCTDKQAMRAYMGDKLAVMDGMLYAEISDEYSVAYAQYKADSQVRVDGRVIVILTVMALSMVMLYLLCRAQAQERIGMLAVYRLLGIPGKKLYGIFAMESLLSSLRTALPVTGLVWLAIQVLNQIEDLNLGLVLSWQAALLVWAGLAVYYLLVCLLPLGRLLRLPPAKLAAKYDF
jgi:hypothetical protein